MALEGKSKEQIARFEREKEIIEAEINKHSQDLQNRNLTVDEVNTTLLELKISSEDASEGQKRVHELQKSFEIKEDRYKKLISQVILQIIALFLTKRKKKIDASVREYNAFIAKLAAIPALEIREDELKIEFDPISEDPIKDFPIDFQTKHIVKKTITIVFLYSHKASC